MNKTAISYARFSSAGQAEGHSLSRQIERAEEYASANGLAIDQNLSFKDLGVSAWDRSNIEKGALGLFLQAITEGRVPKGATLIVESFDRLSRAEPIDALAIFQQIIASGLNLVTLTEPPKRFSRQTLRENPFQLFEALLDMHRANAESDRKSDLISKSWEKRRKSAIESKAVMTSKAPLWIKAEGPPKAKKFSLIPERVKVVKRVVQMAKAGVGNHSIIKTLHAEGVPSWPRSEKEEAKRQADGRTHTWEPSYIQKMLSQTALYGAVEIKGGEIVEGYYPPIMTFEEYQELQSLRRVRSKRAPSTRKGVGVTNLFSGLLYCGYCGSKMIVSGYTRRTDGETHKYLACHGARTGKTDCRMHGWGLKKLENELLAFLPEIDYARLLGGTGKNEAEEKLVAVLDQQAEDLKAKIERVYVAIEEGATGMVPRVKAHEAELEKVEKALKDAKQHLAGLNAANFEGIAEAYIAIRRAMISAKKDPVKLRAFREQLSELIARTVERITLHPIGRGKRGEPSLDIVLRSGTKFEYTPESVDF